MDAGTRMQVTLAMQCAQDHPRFYQGWLDGATFGKNFKCRVFNTKRHSKFWLKRAVAGRTFEQLSKFLHQIITKLFLLIGENFSKISSTIFE